LVSYARRYLDEEDWRSFTVSDDPDNIIRESAIKILLKNCDQHYDGDVVKALINVIHKNENIDPAAMVEVDELEDGMVLREDLRLKGGRLLLTKGTRLETKSIEAIQGMVGRGMITGKIYVSMCRK
jgi:hypothetical protein